MQVGELLVKVLLILPPSSPCAVSRSLVRVVASGWTCGLCVGGRPVNVSGCSSLIRCAAVFGGEVGSKFRRDARHLLPAWRLVRVPVKTEVGQVRP